MCLEIRAKRVWGKRPEIWKDKVHGIGNDWP